MKRFKDSTGRQWEIVVNVGTAKNVKALTTVNLFDLYVEEGQRLFSDPCLLVDVLYVLCAEQCKALNVTDEQFGQSLVGDAIEHAATALMEEVADFFPSSRRALFQKMRDKSTAIAEKMTAKALAALDQMDVESLPASTKSQA